MNQPRDLRYVSLNPRQAALMKFHVGQPIIRVDRFRAAKSQDDDIAPPRDKSLRQETTKNTRLLKTPFDQKTRYVRLR